MLNRPGENPDCNDLISLWEWGGTGGNYMGDYIENEEKLDKKVKNLMQLVECFTHGYCTVCHEGV